ncbi:MAG: hypothetical protein ABIH42_08730 [Planctomycetota bacterium]
MSNESKKVIFVAYYFPPIGGGLSQRAVGFTRYLPQYNWSPEVIAAPSNTDVLYYDENLLQSIPETINVHRIKCYYASKLHFFSKKVKLARLLHFIRRPFLMPDAVNGWAKKAGEFAAKLASNQHIDAVLTTSFPYSAHLVGLRLNEQFGIRWVADFRDPWTTKYDYKSFTPLYKHFEVNLEKKSIRNVTLLLLILKATRTNY